MGTAVLYGGERSPEWHSWLFTLVFAGVVIFLAFLRSRMSAAGDFYLSLVSVCNLLGIKPEEFTRMQGGLPEVARAKLRELAARIEDLRKHRPHDKKLHLWARSELNYAYDLFRKWNFVTEGDYQRSFREG